MRITIFMPEGSSLHTGNVAEADIASHIAGNSWHAREAELLAEFIAAEPGDTPKGWKLVESGGSPELPFETYETP